jgi:hypothetical protein
MLVLIKETPEDCSRITDKAPSFRLNPPLKICTRRECNPVKGAS